MTQCKDLNSDMTSGYVHIDITYFFYLSIRIKLYYFVIYNHVISVNVADFLFCVCYFKKIQKNVRIIRKALFALVLRSRIWRESSRQKMTLRPVNTPTGEQMKQTVEASKTAPLFFAFLQLKGWNMLIYGVRLWNGYNHVIFIEFIETK